MKNREMPKMNGIEMGGEIYVHEPECRAAVNWALKNGRQPLFDRMLKSLIRVRARFQDLRLGPDESSILDEVDATIKEVQPHM